MDTFVQSLPVKELGAVAALVCVYFIITAVTKLIKIFRNGKELNSMSATTFEERLAFVENKTLTLENNHLSHLSQDVIELRNKIDNLNNTCTNHFFKISERVAVLETKIKVK